ncbi:MAG TPA: F0F1 ATP synthase subunit delta [Verrucomicrobiae bacterium]|nr:F0F1 ATP synthase subunit delta [Verrucomicrobiae bacterium]
MKIKKQARHEAKRLYRFCLVNGLLDENRARQVARGVLASGDRDARGILAHFLRLVKSDRAAHTAIVESATPVPAELRSTITSGLQRRYGSSLAAEFVQRPELIGGVRVQVGCDVFDGSVRAKLAELQRRF